MARTGIVLVLSLGSLFTAMGEVSAQPADAGGEPATGDAPRPPPVARSANDDDRPSLPPPATDPEMPRRMVRRPRYAAQPPQPGWYRTDEGEDRPIRDPKWGIILEVGLGGGGDDLVKVALSDGSSQTLSAGDGVALSIGLMATPLWIGDGLGLGLSGTIGYKGWSVGGSNGDISIGRFPLVLAAHVLPRLTPRWLLLLRGGLDKEEDASISGSGFAAGTNLDLTAKLGWFVEGGVYSIIDTTEQRGAWSLTFRYTQITYTASDPYAGEGSANGESFMIFNSYYYNP